MVDNAAVEAQLRKRSETQRGIAGFGYRMLTGDERYWSGSIAASMAVIEDLDSPRRCEVAATTAAERFGLPVVYGFVAIGDTLDAAEIVAHYWNLNERGEPVDASLARRRPLGYLGKILSDSELATVSRFSFLSRVG